MRFLFINQYYSPDFAATAQQMADLCEKLATLGHEVHVLTSRAIYDGRKLDIPSYEVLNGVHVHRVGIASTGRERIRQRLLGYLIFYIKAFAKINFMPRPDVVVTLTTPPMISLLGAWLRLFRRSRFVYWVMDIYPDIAIRAGVLSRVGVIRALWSALGRLSYLTANRIVVLGQDMKDVVRKKGLWRDKIDVINSWASSEEIHPQPRDQNQFRAQYLRPDAFCLMYSGNMGTCHAFRSATTAIKSLSQRKDIHFSFVGGGKQLPHIKEALGSNTQNTIFLPYQDRSSLAESLSAPDAHLITLQPRYDGLLVPSKLYGIMAAGRAVVFAGSDNNEIARIIRRAQCGVVIAHDDPEAFREAVEWMAANPAEVHAMGERGHEYFLRNFDTEILTTRFAMMLEQQGLQPGVRGVRALAHKTLAFVRTSRSSSEDRGILNTKQPPH